MDDLVLLEEILSALKSLFEQLQKMASKVGLQINETETEYMVVSRQETIGIYPSLEVTNYVFNRTKQFKYLGSVLTENNEIERKISARINAGNKSFYELQKLPRSRSLSSDLRIQLYITLLRSIIIYGAETWLLRKIDEKNY